MQACSTGNGFEYRKLESGIRVTVVVALDKQTGAGGKGGQRRGCHDAQRTELGTSLLLRHSPLRISPWPWGTSGAHLSTYPIFIGVEPLPEGHLP